MAKAARVHGDTEGKAAAEYNSVLGSIYPARLEDHWESRHWIREHYEKKHSLVQTYVTLAISNDYVVDAAKRARLCGAGASRSEGFDSVSSVLALFLACDDQRARVPAMAMLGKVYDEIFDGSKYTCRQMGAATIELDAFDAPVMCALIRLFLMKDTSNVQRAAAETIGVSAMCTRGPVLETPPFRILRVSSRRYAQIGQLKGTGADLVDWTERCAIMAKRDVHVRQSQEAWAVALHPTERSNQLVILSMKAQANALNMGDQPRRLLVVGVIGVCQRDLTAKGWSRFESPWGRLFAVGLCAHVGACPGPDTCAIPRPVGRVRSDGEG